MRKLKAIIVKELLDLFRDRTTLISMVVIPLIIFPLMGMAFSGAREAATQTVRLAVLNLDNGGLGENLVTFLNKSETLNITLVNGSGASPKELVTKLYREEGLNELLIIPENFTKLALDPNATASLTLYSYTSPGGLVVASADRFLEAYRSVVVQMRIKELNGTADPSKVLNPFQVRYRSIVSGKVIQSPPTLVRQILASQSWALPIATLIVIMSSMQIIASAVASEKEMKTIETLLSTPISRFSILVGKVISSMVIAIISAASYMVGFGIYMGQITSSSTTVRIPPELVEQVTSIITSPIVIGGSGLLMFMALLTAVSIAVSLSVYAEDARSAQALVSYVGLPLLIPAMIVMSVDPERLPETARMILYAIPFTHAFVGINRLIEGNYMAVVIGILYMLGFSAAFLYIAARSFKSEKILTARFRFFRKKR